MQVIQRVGIVTVAAGLLLVSPFEGQAASSLTAAVTVEAAPAAAARTRSFTLKHGTQTWVVPAATVRQWFTTTASDDGTRLTLRPGAIYDYLNVFISPKLNTLPVASRFVRHGGKVVQVGGGSKGKIVDGAATSLAIRAALVAGRSSAQVSLKEARPSIFAAADFAKLTFPHKLARGESSFAGSPRNRVHNIQVATKRFNGLVILPGEEFSFNQYLGAVDASNGYLPELVIKQNVTTPELGGGICQVSTTVFRGALQAGLQITQRRNHSYPVRYYGTPGYDATVYPPATDFKFKNDTGKPIHLLATIEGTRVIFDVWGTKDGRTVTVNGPVVTSRKPDGSLTAAVAQIVKKQGKSIREQNFVSTYKSPDLFPTVRAANGE